MLVQNHLGLSCPDIIKVATAYGIKSERILNNDRLHSKIDNVLVERGPFVCEVIMPKDQQLIPRVSSIKKPDGSIVSKPLEDLYPFLGKDEFLENMIVEPVEILEQHNS